VGNSLLLGYFKIMASPICRREAFRYLLLPLCHGARNRGPDIAHTKQNETRKGDQLADQCQVNVHV
jgi:hypothetical protein